MNKKYLGDGVYAEQDPNDMETLILTTENGYGETNRIVLEVEVLNKLALYLGLERTRDALRGVIHGKTCEKESHHVGVAYMHDATDDGPYLVDGLTYCGRCHLWIPEEIHD